jgi:hypothetical protein
VIAVPGNTCWPPIWLNIQTTGVFIRAPMLTLVVALLLCPF